jgi:hypothetical protein
MYRTSGGTAIKIAHLVLNPAQKTIAVSSEFTMTQNDPQTNTLLNLSPFILKDPNGDAELISFSCATTCQVDAFRLDPLTLNASPLGHLELPDVQARSSKAILDISNNKIQIFFPNGTSSDPLQTRVYLLQHIQLTTSTSTQRPSTSTTTRSTTRTTTSAGQSPDNVPQDQDDDALKESSSSKSEATLNTTSIAGIIVAGVIVVAGVIIGAVICKRGDKKTHPTMLVVTQEAFDQMLDNGSVVNPLDLRSLHTAASLNGLPTSGIHQQRLAGAEDSNSEFYEDITNFGPEVSMATHPSLQYEQPVLGNGSGYLQVDPAAVPGSLSNPTYDRSSASATYDQASATGHYDSRTLEGLDDN